MINKAKTTENKKSIIQNVGIFASSLLVAFMAVYFYSPVIETHAEYTIPDNGSNSTIKGTVNVKEVINVTTSAPKITVGSDNNFASSAGSVSVETNSKYGYSLYIEDLDDDTSLRHELDPENGFISSEFDGTKTSETMPVNSWGYSLSDTDFSKIPAYGSGVVIKKTTTPSYKTSDIVTVNFGIKTGNGNPYGYYYDKIMFTAVANAQDGGLNLETMQGFYCSALDLPDQATGAVSSVVLKDMRNNKTYRVARLADGKCWMLDDLMISGTSIDATYSSYIGKYSYDNYYLPSYSSSWYTTTSGQVYAEYNYSSYIYVNYKYNYIAASANKYSYNSNNLNNKNVKESICPSGWLIPTYEEWNGLMGAYNEPDGGFDKESALELPINLLASGGIYTYDSRSISGKDSMGGWWLRSTNLSEEGATYDNTRDVVILDDNGLRTTSYDTKNGFAIRCVASGNGLYDTSSSRSSNDND